MSNILKGLNEGRNYGRDSWDSNMPGYQGDYGGAKNFGRRNREWDEDDRIDARIRAEYEKKKEYEQNGTFWLKLKDSQRHLPAGPFKGKQAANTAAIELLSQQPELKGNLVITAYGPDETQGVAEGWFTDLFKKKEPSATTPIDRKQKLFQPIIDVGTIFSYVNVKYNGNDISLGLKTDTARESAFALEEVKLLRKTIQSVKKEVRSRMSELRQAHTDRVANRGAMIPGGGKVGTILRYAVRASRAAQRGDISSTLKAVQDTVIAPLDRMLLICDKFEIHLKKEIISGDKNTKKIKPMPSKTIPTQRIDPSVTTPIEQPPVKKSTPNISKPSVSTTNKNVNPELEKRLAARKAGKLQYAGNLEEQEVAEGQLDELSPQTLASYKKKAGADATQADKRGDYARGDKRMSGIVKATKKEFDNDAKGIEEEKQRLDPSCWKGYKKQGTKMKGDTRVNNCVPVKESAIMKGLK